VALGIRDYEEAMSGRCGCGADDHADCADADAAEVGAILIAPVLDSLVAAGVFDRADAAHLLALAAEAIAGRIDASEDEAGGDPLLSRSEMSRLLDDSVIGE
jgi:hypothetical protein